jgi:hypothetical protein
LLQPLINIELIAAVTRRVFLIVFICLIFKLKK